MNIASPTVTALACLIAVGTYLPAHAQKKEAEPIPEGWQRGIGFGADLGQLLLLNPRVGSGENRIGLGTNLTAFAKLKREKLNWDTNLALNFAVQKLGAGVLPPIPGVAQTRIPYQKSIDELRVATQVGYSFSESSPWGYGFEFTLLTQATPTYQDSSGRNLLKDTDGNNASGPIAKFFSPVTITASPGITYRPGPHFDALVSPASLKTVFVADDQVRALPLYAYLDKEGNGERRLLQLGASVRANYSNKFLKDDRLVFKSTLGLFSNYLRNPQNVDLDFRNEVGVTIVKGLTVTLNAIALYDDDIPVQITDFDTVGGIVRDEEGEPVLGRRLTVTEQILIKYAVVF